MHILRPSKIPHVAVRGYLDGAILPWTSSPSGILPALHGVRWSLHMFWTFSAQIGTNFRSCFLQIVQPRFFSCTEARLFEQFVEDRVTYIYIIKTLAYLVLTLRWLCVMLLHFFGTPCPGAITSLHFSHGGHGVQHGGRRPSWGAAVSFDPKRSSFLLQLVGACHGPFYFWTQLDSPVFSKLFFNRNFGQRLMGCKFNVWEHDLESWDVSQSSQIPQLDPRIYSYNIHIYIYIYIYI